jgi:hypothetical protein
MYDEENHSKENPTVILLQETKCNNNILTNLASKLWKHSQVISIDAQGVTRGLDILWNPSEISLTTYFLSTVRTLSSHFHLIGTTTSVLHNQCLWSPICLIITFSSDLIQALKTIIGDKHWIIGGDFNIITSLDEK